MTAENIIEARAEHYSPDYRQKSKPHDANFTVRVEAQEAREEDDGALVVEGYAAITDAAYVVRDFLGEYEETLARGAFAKTLREQDDVRWLVNHDDIPLARTAAKTLDLREIVNPDDDPQAMGQTGLWTSARLDPTSPLVQTVRSAIERGDMSQMSFAFQAKRQEWNEDYTERTVLEARLFDVSAVTYPANPATSVTVGKRAEPEQAAERERAEREAIDAAEINRRRHKLATH